MVEIKTAKAMRDFSNLNGGMLKNILEEVRLAANLGKYKNIITLPACFSIGEAKSLIIILSVDYGFYIKRLSTYPFQFILYWDVPRISCKNPESCYAAKARAKANRFNKIFMMIYKEIEHTAHFGDTKVTINYKDYGMTQTLDESDFTNPHAISAIYMSSPFELAGYEVRRSPYSMSIDWSV